MRRSIVTAILRVVSNPASLALAILCAIPPPLTAAPAFPPRLSRGPIVGPDAAALERLVPHAAGLFRARVTSVNERDYTASDGPRILEVELHLLASTGVAHSSITITLDPGGYSPPDDPPLPVPLFALEPEDLEVGETYWFASASRHVNSYHYPQGLLRIWQDGDRPAENILLRATHDDAYRWQPEFCDADGDTYGVMSGPDHTIRVRGWRGNQFRWERTFPNAGLTGEYPAWRLAHAWDIVDGRRPAVPDSTLIFAIELKTTLKAHNAFHLPADTYRVLHFLMAHTGRELGTRVFTHPGDEVERAFQTFDPVTGRLISASP